MKITDVKAVVLRVPIQVPRIETEREVRVVFTEVNTDEGLSGYGTSGMMFQESTREFVNKRIAPLINGENPIETEKIRNLLQEELNPYNQTGVWSTAVSTVDIALWDIKGKYFGEPVWRLLGGDGDTVPVMVTPGLAEYDEPQLVSVFEEYASRGMTLLKMQVGRQTTPDPIADASRIHAVRDAVDESVEIAIDANEKYSLVEALELCNRINDITISCFEEPVRNNDSERLADLRNRTRIPIAAGQNEGNGVRHREFMTNGSVDIVQPNVCYVGGFTEGMKVATVAQAFNFPIANGGGYGPFNAHLIGAVPNGTYVEFNPLSWQPNEIIYRNTPIPDGNTITLGTEPGLGLEPDRNAIERYRIQ